MQTAKRTEISDWDDVAKETLDTEVPPALGGLPTSKPLLIAIYFLIGLGESVTNIGLWVSCHQLFPGDAPAAQTLLSMCYVGWLFKPIIGLLVETRWASWRTRLRVLVIMSTSSALGSVVLAAAELQVWQFLLAVILTGAGEAGMQLFVEGHMCRIVKRQDTLGGEGSGGRLQSLALGARFAATAFGETVGGVTSENYGPSVGFAISAATLLLLTPMIICLLRAERTHGGQAESKTSRRQKPSLLMHAQAHGQVAVFIFAFHFGANIDAIYAYWAMDTRGVTSTVIGIMNTCGYFGMASGAVLYRCIPFVQLRQQQYTLAFLHILETLAQLCVLLQVYRVTFGTSFWTWQSADEAFMTAFANFRMLLQGVAGVAVQNIAAKHTTNGSEELMYSVYAALTSAAKGVSELIGAGIATRLGVSGGEYKRFDILLVECVTVTSMFCIAVILLPTAPRGVAFSRVQTHSESDSEGETPLKGTEVRLQQRAAESPTGSDVTEMPPVGRP